MKTDIKKLRDNLVFCLLKDAIRYKNQTSVTSIDSLSEISARLQEYSMAIYKIEHARSVLKIKDVLVSLGYKEGCFYSFLQTT